MAKPQVKKIILFWLDNIPEKRDAQAIADLLPLQMHRELVFETTQAVNDKISGKSILKLTDKFIIPVSSTLAAAVLDKKTRIKRKEFGEIAAILAMHIAVMKTILERLKKKHRFDLDKSPNRLICKYIETTTSHCYYALVLDSEIDPSKYDFATGFGGCTLSALFWEVAQLDKMLAMRVK